MKISSTKRAAILATVLSGFALGQSAEAANIAAVTATNYLNSHLGSIEGSFIHSDVDIVANEALIQGLNRDPMVFNTIDPVTGKSTLYIRQYSYSTTNLANSYAFEAQGDWKTSATGVTSGAANAHDVVRNNNYVYVASYDEGTIGIGQVTAENILDLPTLTRNLKQDLIDYEGLSFGRNAQLHGEGVTIIDGNLYVVANVNPKGGYTPYDPSYLMKYIIQEDGSLKYDGYTLMGKNTDSVRLNVYNNHILTTAIGGYQNYGENVTNKETSLNVATIDPEYGYLDSSRSIKVPGNVKSEFRSLKVLPNGTAYVMTYNIAKGGNSIDLYVYQTTVSNLLSENPKNWKEVYSEKGAAGWFGKLDAEYYTKRLWVQVGNKLDIYTDGNTEALTFTPSSFSANALYKELYGWTVIRPDVMAGNLAKLAEGDDKQANANAVWKDATYNNTISEIGTNKLGSGTVVSVGEGKEGNLDNNVLAAIYADGGTVVVDVNGKLQLQAENNIATPVGIYAGNGGSAEVTSKTTNVITKVWEGGNSLTNAIWVDPSLEGGESITLNSVNVTMEGGYGGHAVAIQKTDRWGEHSQESANGGSVNINGDLTVKGADNKTWGITANKDNVLSRFNNSGIFVGVDNSKVTVSGNVDMDVYGNGVTVNGDKAKVVITKGGSITVPSGTDYGYYALAAYDGSISMNGIAGDNDVQINGDLFALKDGKITLGLSTKESYLNGIIDSGGTVNLYLKNGAEWNNIANNSRYEQDNEDYGNGENSRVTNLYGGDTLETAGTIIQKANSGFVQIGNLHGSLNVKYSLDDNNPTNVLGGNVTIAKATEGSNIALKTDWHNIDELLVNDVLNSLANKLYYAEAVDGVNNLFGTVAISESLVKSSIVRTAEIKFIQSTGQGSLTGNEEDGTGANPNPYVENIAGGDTGTDEGDTGEGETPSEPGGSEPTPEPEPDEEDSNAPKLDKVVKLPVAEGTTVVANAKAQWNHEPDIKEYYLISNNETFTIADNKVIQVGHISSDTETGDIVDNTVLAALDVSAGNGTVLISNGKALQLQIDKNTGNSAGIYVANGKKLTYKQNNKSDITDINIIAKNERGQKTNGIWIDPTLGNSNFEGTSKLNGSKTNTNININITGGNGGNGIVVSKSDGTKETNYTGVFKFAGNVNIKGTDNTEWGIVANRDNDDPRYNNAGILVNANKGNVNINGTVDMAVYGNGVTVDATGANVAIGDASGNNKMPVSRIIVPQNTNNQYYALAAYNGSISVKSGTNNWMIDGDIYVGEGGTVDLSLKGDGSSYLEGAVTNNGVFNLSLANGSTWTNIANNGDCYIDTKINTLKSSSDSRGAFIVQTPQSGNITVGTYGVINTRTGGHLYVGYEHSADEPTKIYGGTIKIDNVTASISGKETAITLYTDSNGINTGDSEEVNLVLNRLANKLYYLNSANGGLFAYVKIGEGITSTAVQKEIKFIESTGQGSLTGNEVDGYVWASPEELDDTGTQRPAPEYDERPWLDGEGGTVEPDEPEVEYPDAQVVDKFTTSLTGIKQYDTEYYDGGVVANKTYYNFTKDKTTIDAIGHRIDPGAYGLVKDIGVGISSTAGNLTVDLNGNDMDIIVKGDVGVAAVNSSDSVNIKDAGNIYINVINDTGSGYATGLHANSGAEVHIDNSDGGVVTINNWAYNSINGCGIKTKNGIGGQRSWVEVTGLVDIQGNLVNGQGMSEGLSAVGSTIDVGGGRIIMNDDGTGGDIGGFAGGSCFAIRSLTEFVTDANGVANRGIVNVNVIKDANTSTANAIGAGDNYVQIKGDVGTKGDMGSYGLVNLGLNTMDSYWHGNYSAAIDKSYGMASGLLNLWMGNKAEWKGYTKYRTNIDMDSGSTWYGYAIVDPEADPEYEYDESLGAVRTDLAIRNNAMWTPANLDGSTIECSTISKLTGAKANEKTGYIYMSDAKGMDVTVNEYSGRTTLLYAHDNDDPTIINGGTFTVNNALDNSKITLMTDNTGIDVSNDEKVIEVLNALANKLYYTEAINGTVKLKGEAVIAEGLTASSVGQKLGNITYGQNGQGSVTELGQFVEEYTTQISGNSKVDKFYVDVGVLKKNVYNFNSPLTKLHVTEGKIESGGAWMQSIGAAIYSNNPGMKTNIDMHGNDLDVNSTYSGGDNAAINAVDKGVIVIDSPGNISATATGHARITAIYANSGGEIYINNAEGGVVDAYASSSVAKGGVAIKTMNGVNGEVSKIVIDGLANAVADSENGSNEAISCVASTIEIGGGNIEARNNAWAAIRAYNEFVSSNNGVVNINVLKDNEGNVYGSGNNKTTIKGDLVTKGGMGSGGNISIGLNGKESSWVGNYADNEGEGNRSGVIDGEVNLYMKDGAAWKGFNDGEMYLTMEGEGTTWYGFNIAEHEDDGGPDTIQVSRFDENGNMYLEDVTRETKNGGLFLTLKDGALWQNAITTAQGTDSKVYEFNGQNGYIDMTGNKTFKATTSFAHDGNGCDFKNTFIVENDTPQETGNLVITNYSGDTTVIYRHDDKNVTNILGGTTTIKNASEGSNITLSTDSTGIDMTNTTEVTNVLDNLAEKLFYTAYATENERNLSGKVQIAEGLTTSSVGKYFAEIEFDANNQGQGSMKDGSLTKPSNTPTNPPAGDEDGEKPEDKPVVPEVKPEQKPVVDKTFKDGIDSNDLSNLKNDETFGSVVDPAESGKLDFGKLDKDEHGKDKPASEHVDTVKVEGDVKHNSTTPFVWDMDAKGLHIGGKTEVTGGTYEIQNAGDVTLKGNTEVKGDGTNKGVLKIDNKENGGKVIFEGAEDSTAPVLNVGENAEVDVKGKVEIINTNGNVAVSVGKDSTVAIGGGVIGDEGTVAIAVKDGGSIEINKEGGQSVVINGKILLGNPQSKMMMMKVAPKAIEVPAGASSFNLTDDRSSMNDDVQYTGTGNNDFVAGISNGAKWTGNSVGGVDLDVILADGGAWTGYHEDDNSTAKLDMQISNGATWTNTATDATTVDTMSGDGGFVKMSEDANAGLTIKDYSGATTFIYRHNADNDILGGNVNIQKATDGSVVNVRTNSIGTSDKEEVTKVLQALAAKMIAGDNAKTVLKGEAQIAEGIVTSASALKVGNIDFTNGTGDLDEESITARYPDSGYIYGDSETAMMKGAKSAMASTVMMWRSESNDLLQRMGDVRLATEESGVWAKYYGGKYEMDAQNTNFSTNYKAYQVGYDKAVGNGWNVGVAVSHNEGDSRYDRGGEGEMTVTSLSVYGNKDYGDGRYLGLILKGSQLKNEYEVFNNDGYKLEGDFKTWGTSISAEYGKRIEKGNGFYFDPSVELTIGHVQGKDYTATSDMLAAYGKTATMQVEQDDFNSIIGRVGFGIGQRTERASYYAKLALAHEFGGDFDTHYTAEETKGTNIDFGDTWYEMQLGGTAKLSDNSLLYATYERSFGGDVTEKWRVDAGLRVTF